MSNHERFIGETLEYALVHLERNEPKNRKELEEFVYSILELVDYYEVESKTLYLKPTIVAIKAKIRGENK